MEFAKVFIIGMILLFGVYIALGGFDFSYYDSSGYRFAPSSRNDTPSQSTITSGDFVGNRAVEDFKKYVFSNEPFLVSRVAKEEVLTSYDDLWVENGIFGNEDYTQTFTLTQEELKEITEPKLSLDLKQTNLYGRLMVILNDKKIFYDFLEGEEEIQLNTSLFKEENKITIIPESSSWRIWAPTVYLLDFELKTGFFGESSQTFDFEVLQEHSPVKYSRIILDIPEREGDGNLVVEVNDNVVFNFTPTSRQWIEFDNSVICGNNTVDFVSEGNAKFKITEFQFIIFYDEEAEEYLEYDFYVSSYNYNRLPGEVRFKIERVFGSPTSLVAKVENPDGHKKSLVVQGVLQEGRYVTMDLPKSYTEPGDNKIIFSVTGDGGFSISDLKVYY